MSETRSTELATAGGDSRWAHAAAACLVVTVAWAALYWDTLTALYRTWENAEAYGHWVLMIPLCVYLVWGERHRLARCSPSPAWLAQAGVVLFGMAWLAARVVDVNVVQQVAVLAILISASVALLGWRAGFIVAVPLGFLIFVIPIWSHLVPILQDHTAKAAARSLQLLGVPVYHEGFYLSIPNGQFVVAEVCAGLRFLLATLCITALYAYLNLRTVRTRVIFMVVGAVLSVVSNWVRVDAIVLIGHHAGMDHPLVGSYHTYLGWGVFAVALVPLFVFGAWCQRLRIEGDERGRASPAPSTDVGTRSTARIWSAALVTIGTFALGPALYALTLGPAPAVRVAQAPAIEMPAGQGGWVGPVDGPDALGATYVGATSETTARYTHAQSGAQVSLHLVSYARQGEGRELVSDGNTSYDTQRWTLLRAGESHLEWGAGRSSIVRSLELRSPVEDWLVLQWYVVGGQVTGSAAKGKLLQLWAVATGRPTALAVSVATASRDGARNASSRLLAEFASLHWPLLESQLQPTANESRVTLFSFRSGDRYRM